MGVGQVFTKYVFCVSEDLIFINVAKLMFNLSWDWCLFQKKKIALQSEVVDCIVVG